MLEEIKHYFHPTETPPPDLTERTVKINNAVKIYCEAPLASKERLAAFHELETLIPDENERQTTIGSYRSES